VGSLLLLCGRVGILLLFGVSDRAGIFVLFALVLIFVMHSRGRFTLCCVGICALCFCSCLYLYFAPQRCFLCYAMRVGLLCSCWSQRSTHTHTHTHTHTPQATNARRHKISKHRVCIIESSSYFHAPPATETANCTNAHKATAGMLRNLAEHRGSSLTRLCCCARRAASLEDALSVESRAHAPKPTKLIVVVAAAAVVQAC